jgi:CheY-like chemotaxis protein
MAGRKIQEITENLRSADFSSLIDYVGEVKMIDIRTDRKTKFQPNIMVVDDDPNMSELFYEMLSEKGYWVATMNSGIAAVEALSEKRFDLALVDLMMPEMNGVETIKLLKEKQPDIRIILHTGYANDEKINEAVSAGAMRVLYKPFQQEYLLKMVRQVVSMEDKKL